MRPSVTNEWQTRSVRHSAMSSGASGTAGQRTRTEGVKVGFSALPFQRQRGPEPSPYWMTWFATTRTHEHQLISLQLAELGGHGAHFATALT